MKEISAAALAPAKSHSETDAVRKALQDAARKTGVGFDVLYRIAVRESALDKDARATTSSAAGLFQFIEQTWLASVKEFGARHGLSTAAADIVERPDGGYAVADPVRRQEILNLRFDADKASALAAELALQNKKSLERSLGRAVTAGELYAAHFLGPGGARRLLRAGADALAADILPKAAAANKPVFFKDGRAQTVAELMKSFTESMSAEVREIKSAFLKPARGATETPLAPLQGRQHMAALNHAVLAPEADVSRVRPSSLEFASMPGFSPLALVILQALDPTALRKSASPQ